MTESRETIVNRVTAALEGEPSAFAIRNARRVDARGIREHVWVVASPVA